jgi:hypothetical protein
MLTLAHRMMLGAASRPKNDARIITLAGPSSQLDLGVGIARDADGNLYLAGSGGSTRAGYIVKMGPGGAVVWQRKLSLAGYMDLLAVDVEAVTGAVYVCGQGRASGSVNAGYVAKFSTDGVLQWQRKISAAYTVKPNSVRIDASGNVFVLASMADTVSKTLIVKYSTGGVQQWQRVLSHATEGLVSATNFVIDSSGNLLIADTRRVGASDYWPTLIVCNSSGVIQSQVAVRMASNAANYGWAVAVDDSGNMYLAGQTYVSASARAFVCKLNSAGVVQWLRYVTSSALTRFFAVFVDGDGRVYAVGSDSRVFVFQASDGALVWQREIKASTSMSAGSTAIHADANLHFYATFYTLSGDTDAGAVSLPDSGEGTGTYGGVITYSESTDTTTAGSPTTATPAFTDAAGSLTEAAGDMTDAAGNLTATERVKTS